MQSQNVLIYLIFLISTLKFSLSTSLNEKEEINTDAEHLINNFKAVAMHFAEPFLTETHVRGLKMEGFDHRVIVPIISKFMKQSAITSKDEGMIKFAEALERSYTIWHDAYRLRNQESDVSMDSLSERIFKMNKNEYRAFPVGWLGLYPHSLLMIISRADTKEKFFDLTITNTGMGISYHDAKADTDNNVVPLTYRVWKRFKSIPMDRFTDGDNWFIQGLGLLFDYETLKKAVKDDFKPEKYFYETFLANFKEYEVKTEDDDDDDDRFTNGQLSGSCSYSSVMAGLLYFSKDKTEFLRRKFFYGQVLLESFLKQFDKIELLKMILSDAYEPMARYLMKHLASGVAYQALELLENSNIKLGFANLLSSKNEGSAISLSDLSEFEHIDQIKSAIQNAVKIYKLLADTKVDKNTANVIHEDISSCPVARLDKIIFKSAQFSLSKEEIEKLKIDEYNWPGIKHPYIANESEYSRFFPAKFKNLAELAETLELIEKKSENEIYLDTIMNTYLFDFFTIASPNMEALIKVGSESACNRIMTSAKLIMRRFNEESILPMAIEDLASMTQLLLLTWRVAKRYDSLQSTYKINLENYSAPVSPKLLANVLGISDPNSHIDSESKYNIFAVPLDTCSIAPDWLTTEDDLAAWYWFEKAKTALLTPEYLKNGSVKPSIFDPEYFFPSIFATRASANLLENYAALDVLKQIASHYKSQIDRDRHFFDYQQLVDPYLAIRGVLQSDRKFPQYHKLIDVATYFYFGPWFRPMGTSQHSVAFTFAQFDTRKMIFGPYCLVWNPKRQNENTKERFKRTVPVNELLKYRGIARSTNVNQEFYLNQFFDIRAASALQEPQSSVSFYAFLSMIEGAKSCVFFTHSKLVFMADRLLGIKTQFEDDLNLILRVHEALKTAISSEMIYFVSKHELMELSKKEKHINRMINASLVHMRFLLRVSCWGAPELIHNKIQATKSLAKIYNDWSRLGSLKSNFAITEDIVGKINILLWECVNMGKHFTDFKPFTEECVSHLPEFKAEADSEIVVSALVSFHFFIATAFTKQMVPTENFDLITKLYSRLRNPPKLTNKKSANLVLKLITRELVAYFDKVEIEDLDKDWQYSIDGTFEFIEIKRKSSDKKIPFIILRISTGRIIVDGIAMIHRSRIYNNAVFRKFFSKEEMLYARNGSIKPIGDKIGYSLSNFRDTGQNFLFITTGEDAVMDIYYHYDNERWFWSNTDEKSTKAFLRPLNLMNLSGIRIYQRYFSDKKLLHAIFVKGNDPEPLYRLKIENVNDAKNSQFEMKLPFIEKPLLLLNSTETEYYLPKALKDFARPELMSVYRSDDNRSVVMYGAYRIGEDDVPLIFEERFDDIDPKKKTFVLLNQDSWCIDEDQSIDNGKIILGTMKIRLINDPDTKALLLPNFEWKKKLSGKTSFSLNYPKIPVEFIKISKEELMPKDRFERFVLAYKFMIGVETEMARKLLNPIQSIDQNSPFNGKEAKMIEWILELEIENPEIYALKMMTAVHYYINALNYPSNRNTMKTFKAGYIPFNYLSAVRELSNKFYLHRIFPEAIANDFIFMSLFQLQFNLNSFGKIPGARFFENYSTYQNKVDNIFYEISRYGNENKRNPLFSMDTFDWRSIDRTVNLDSSNFWDLLSLIIENQENSIAATNYYRLHYRRNQIPQVVSPSLVSFDYELLLYCAHKTENGVFNTLQSLMQKSDKIFSEMKEYDRLKFKKNLELCFFNEQKYMLEAIVQPKDQTKSLTDIVETRKVFKSDSKSKSKIFAEDYDQLPDDEYFSIENESTFKKLIDLINEKSKSKSKHTQNGIGKAFFEAELRLSKRSLVLNKLSESISNFNSYQSIDGSVVIDLSSIDEKDLFDEFVELKTVLDVLIENLGKSLEALFVDLAELTSTSEGSNLLDLIFKLSTTNHSKKKKTFENLYGCYYSMSLDCFIQKFPHITQDIAEILRAKTHIFYSKTVLKDYFKFLQENLLKLIESKKFSFDELSAFSSELEKLGTFKERIRQPGVLNFEFRSNKFRLREEQLNDLKILQTKSRPDESMFKSSVIQRMMAAGKTLVLGTLATVLKARTKDVLSILIPPSSLFQSNSASMQSRTYKYFKSRGIVLNFERISIPNDDETFNSVLKSLIWVKDNLNIALKSRNYLIMSPDSLQSFLNSYIEFVNAYSNFPENGNTLLKSNLEQILQVYAEIYMQFNRKGSIILDEIDMTMNPKKELNYPTMNREKYNFIAVALTTDLMEFAIFSTEIKAQKLQILRNNQAGVTSKAYEEIKRIWLDYIEKSLDDENSLWTQKLFNPSHPQINKENIMKFLRNDPTLSIDNWVDSVKTSPQNELQLKALIIMKRQIDEFLPEAFKTTVKEHFGPAGSSRSGIKFAVPYVAANTPSESSLFADRWETLNKSLLMTAVIGLTESDYADFILWLKEQINLESIVTGSAKSAPTYLNFESLTPGSNPLSIDLEDLEMMKIILSEMGKMNRAAIRLLFSFYLETVIAKIDFPTEQITSNALHMASMFASVQGYSGTIDNINILPAHVVQEAYADHLKNEKDNGGIVQKLIIDSGDKTVSIVYGMDSIKSCRNNIMNLLKAVPETELVNFSALIDVGAFFKNFRNAKVAESLLKIISPRIKCVLYYDEISNMLQYVVEMVKEDTSSETLGTGKSHSHSSEKRVRSFVHGKLALSDPDYITKATGYELKERFTFYDQRHITGSDILQPVDAMALLTFGSRNLLRDILQGALRMRQFMTTQRVFFAITPDVISYYNSLLSNGVTSMKTSNVIALSAFNEDEKQKRENGALSFIKIDVELRRSILMEITDSIMKKSMDEIKGLFDSSRSLFIRNFSENPFSWIKPKEIIPAKDSLKKFIEFRKLGINHKHFRNVGKLIDECPEGKQVTESVLCFAPDNLPDIGGDCTQMNTEVQLEMSALQLNEFELESINADSKFKDLPIKYKRFALGDCKSFRTEFHVNANVICYDKILHQENQLDRVKDIMQASFYAEGSDICFSRELVNIVNTSPDTCPFNLFGSFNLEGTHIFVVEDDVILISNEVANHIRQDSGSCSSDWYVIDLMGNIVLTNAAQLPSLDIFDIRTDDKFKRQFFNALLFNGSLLQLTTNPVTKEMFFGDWVENQGVAGGLAFLMSRMNVLQRKNNYLFDSEDPLISTIAKVINRDTIALESLVKQTYDQNSDIVKKQETAKLAASTVSSSASVYHAQGIYDKISIKHDLNNAESGNDGDIVTDDGSSVSSESENEDEPRKKSGVDMLSFAELSNLGTDQTVYDPILKPASSPKSEPLHPVYFAVGFFFIVWSTAIGILVYLHIKKKKEKNKILDELLSNIKPNSETDNNNYYNENSGYYDERGNYYLYDNNNGYYDNEPESYTHDTHDILDARYTLDILDARDTLDNSSEPNE